MNYRQVHLDFHTSEQIRGIGEKFSKEQFQAALKAGHVNSITVFSKCHHGWSYHPTMVNTMHPHLNFGLLGAQIEAAHAIGVRTPVYISAGVDEKYARSHPEWVSRNSDESIIGTKDFMSPGYHLMCFNSPYLDELVKQVEEVVQNYDADSIFMDICCVKLCYCQNCVQGMLAEGKNPENQKDAEEYAEKIYLKYTDRIRQAVDKYKPGLPLFHNGGHIKHGRRDIVSTNTHLELESLPTGGWGYDHFPMSASYARNLGVEYLGMTGKFHTTWGEFGGYKHPNALRYETALSLAFGAKCSIGDQLHPSGEMDMATYELIGEAYQEVERKEAWCNRAENIADIAVLSVESCIADSNSKNYKSDIGAARILLEGHFLFDFIDNQCDFAKYKVIILPDKIRINNILEKKLQEYINKGGKILATGESGLNEKNAFAFDFGVKWICENPYMPDYFRPYFKLSNLGQSAYIFYGKGQKVELVNGTELGKRENPYFNRSTFQYCSHQHTPNSGEYGGAGMAQGKDGIYIAWNIFEDYAIKGSITLKETVRHALDLLLGDEKTISSNLPVQAVVTMASQLQFGRFVLHVLYATAVKRGENIEVIEDIVPLHDVEITIKTGSTIKSVRLAPRNQELDFEKHKDYITFTIPYLACHQMIELSY